MLKRFQKYMVLSAAVGLYSQVLTAATPLNPGEVITVSVSDKGLTRISIEGEGIKDMFAYPSSENIKLHPSGHLFVAPPEEKGSLFVSLITASGLTQDLNLLFTDKKAAPVVLKAKETKAVSKTQLERWMDAALAGDVPKAFARESLKEEPRYTEQAVAKEVQRFTNGTHSLSLWEVKSRKPGETLLEIKDLLNADEGGKLLDAKLLPFGLTKAVTIQQKKGKNHD